MEQCNYPGCEEVGISCYSDYPFCKEHSSLAEGVVHLALEKWLGKPSPPHKD